MTVKYIEQVKRIAVMMPSWVGDAAMAMPTLRALRGLYPDAVIVGYCKPLVREIIEGCPWVDALETVQKKVKGGAKVASLGKMLKAGRFEMAVLMQNNFRTAWAAKMAGIKRVVGYDREMRGWLLSDGIKPLKEAGRGGKFKKVCTRDYYLEIAAYLSGDGRKFDIEMILHTHEKYDHEVSGIVEKAGVRAGQKLVLLTPGANYGMAKMWEPEKFALVADMISEKYDAAIGVTGSPAEAAVIADLIKAAKCEVINFSALGVGLKQLKSMVKRADFVIANDTGPRHLAIGFGKPVVTIFGPTDPKWTDLGWKLERQVRLDLDCSPCQAKVCPLTGQDGEMACMKGISGAMVFTEVETLWERAGLNNE